MLHRAFGYSPKMQSVKTVRKLILLNYEYKNHVWDHDNRDQKRLTKCETAKNSGIKRHEETN